MTDSLTLNDLLELPNEVLKTCEKYQDYSDLLQESIVNQYYHKNLRKDLNLLFEQFKEIKYSYPFSYLYYTKSIQSDVCIQSSSKNHDPIGNFVSSHMDQYLWLERFYQAVLMLATKLSNQEAVYLVDSFFGHRSEDFISDKLGISRMTLQKIKKSCLVKMYFEFQFLKYTK
ncbi:MAG: hypothetical protein HFI09_03015 [Bacilli bacterium]|nr:hypothetical protein [Bacilli bacterium]